MKNLNNIKSKSIVKSLKEWFPTKIRFKIESYRKVYQTIFNGLTQCTAVGKRLKKKIIQLLESTLVS